jgi:hypothetical protein
MDGESINLGFLLITDPNLKIILNDPDVTMPIKNLIIKMATDKLFINKLSNKIQPDDFKLDGKKTYHKNKDELLSKFKVMIDTFQVRKKDIDYIKRYQKYLKYIEKRF